MIQYRALRFKSFIEDGIYFLESDQKEDALACLKAHKEAIDQRIADIKLADQSEAGWTLIDKLGKSRVPSEIKATETAILTDRRGKKRAYGFPSDIQNFGQNPSPPNFGPGPSVQRFGPCIWCGGQGHGYKTYHAWKDDVAAGRAHFDQNARRWYKVQTADNQPSQAQSHAYTHPPPNFYSQQ